MFCAVGVGGFSTYRVQRLAQISTELLALRSGLFHHVLGECNPIQSCLSVLVVWRVARHVTLQFREIIAIFSEPLEEVELLVVYVFQDSELVEAEEVGSH